MDATPLSLGQEFSAYVQQLDNGKRALTNALEVVAELEVIELLVMDLVPYKEMLYLDYFQVLLIL